MSTFITIPISARAQLTLPKAVRRALRLRTRRDLVGFVIEGQRVALTRIASVPSVDPFSEKEWRAIDRLAAQPPAATVPTGSASLQHLRRHLRRRGR